MTVTKEVFPIERFVRGTTNTFAKSLTIPHGNREPKWRYEEKECKESGEYFRMTMKKTKSVFHIGIVSNHPRAVNQRTSNNAKGYGFDYHDPMKTVLVTGGAGFFGSLLKKTLAEEGHRCVSIDLERDPSTLQNCTCIQGDIRDKGTMQGIFQSYRFDTIFHCAAMLAHHVKNKEALWTSNVDGTAILGECASRYGVPKIIFLSSNCLWGKSLGRKVSEDDVPHPIEIYGKSKYEAEKILLKHTEFSSVIFRCPTIIDGGRLGLLSILFAFIEEGRRVWLVNGGGNRYQFIYAQDLIDACLRAMDYPTTEIFNIGSDDVQTLAEVYKHVIDTAGTKARLGTVPGWLAIPLMQLSHMLGLSPLGPYHYKMIAEDFIFDTTKIKEKLRWNPTLSNAAMMAKAYEYYHQHRSEIEQRSGASAHRKNAKMGIIRVLKYFS